MKHQPKNNQADKDTQGQTTSNRGFVSVKEIKGHQVPNASSASNANRERRPSQRKRENNDE
ncbi:hypothetical protein [Pseudopedobacter beijingensis]|uniref:Uncharacterized protein n=1 Tax=Pseudopedobacter beijingensis TaxID=1207056 RepID=A0ABW4IHC2_9SPHI